MSLVIIYREILFITLVNIIFLFAQHIDNQGDMCILLANQSIHYTSHFSGKIIENAINY